MVWSPARAGWANERSAAVTGMTSCPEVGALAPEKARTAWPLSFTSCTMSPPLPARAMARMSRLPVPGYGLDLAAPGC